LADKVDKRFWPVFSGQNLIDGGWSVRHQCAFGRVFTRFVRDESSRADAVTSTA
jgi:hypothetical protein